MRTAKQSNSSFEASPFWTRVRSYVPNVRQPVSLFEQNPWPTTAHNLDGRGQQEFLMARIGAAGLGGR